MQSSNNGMSARKKTTTKKATPIGANNNRDNVKSSEDPFLSRSMSAAEGWPSPRADAGDGATKRDFIAQQLTCEKVLCDEIIALKKVILMYQSAGMHVESSVDDYLDARSQESVEQELEGIISRLVELKGPNPFHRMTAYAQILGSMNEEIKKLVFTDERRSVSNMQDTIRRLQESYKKEAADLTSIIAQNIRTNNSLEAEKQEMASKYDAVVSRNQYLERELEKARRDQQQLHQNSVELRMQGIDYKSEVTRRCVKVLRSIQSRMGFVPGGVQKQILLLTILKPPGDPMYDEFRRARVADHLQLQRHLLAGAGAATAAEAEEEAIAKAAKAKAKARAKARATNVTVGSHYRNDEFPTALVVGRKLGGGARAAEAAGGESNGSAVAAASAPAPAATSAPCSGASLSSRSSTATTNADFSSRRRSSTQSTNSTLSTTASGSAAASAANVAMLESSRNQRLQHSAAPGYSSAGGNLYASDDDDDEGESEYPDEVVNLGAGSDDGEEVDEDDDDDVDQGVAHALDQKIGANIRGLDADTLKRLLNAGSIDPAEYIAEVLQQTSRIIAATEPAPTSATKAANQPQARPSTSAKTTSLASDTPQKPELKKKKKKKISAGASGSEIGVGAENKKMSRESIASVPTGSESATKPSGKRTEKSKGIKQAAVQTFGKAMKRSGSK